MLRAPPAGPAPGLTPGARAAAPPSATLNGSALVGLLAQLALSDRPAAPPSLVEGLGRWLGWREAIAVSAVLQAPPERSDGRLGAGPGRPTGPTAPPSAAPPTVPAGAATAAASAATRLQAEVQRVRDVLARRFEEALKEAPEDGSDFLPHRRRYFGAQQAMELTLAPLREQARALLARSGPPMAQLAALDAALAGALAPREQALLAQLPVLLEKHHTRLREAASALSPAQPPATAANPAAPAPAARARKPQAAPAWLTTFRHDMRRMLQAELELRLQPTLGLLDALRGPLPSSPGSA
ncbi:DUF3348 family protein [Rubrivivax rivuli]|uniref:DUF3348 family protein n=1 Tax=Rubrivivax rivuli TaxID=1862385 RepID=A0A437RRQ1_9BURK|nr:DUF3348 family protein [Rubrivivax rivuli]RVU49365.1 DUF3348 family protein [Rubrivivax rivuli]